MNSGRRKKICSNPFVTRRRTGKPPRKSYTLSKRRKRNFKYNTLSEEHAKLEASLATVNAKRYNDELKRTKADLQRQLDEWQNLEKKEGNEADSQRKQRVTAETELKRLKDQSEKERKEAEKRINKLEQKAEGLEDVIQELKSAMKDRDRESEASEKKLQKQIQKLKDDLEAERARVAASPVRRPSAPITAEVIDEEEPKKQTRGKKRTASVKPASKAASDDEVEPVAGPSKQPSKTGRKRNSKPTQVAEEEPEAELDEPEEEHEPEPEPEPVQKGKKGKEKAPPSKGKPASKAAAKRKAASNNGETPAAEEPTAKKRKGTVTKAPSTAPVSPPPGTSKSQSESPTEQPQPKKKRKLNVFPSKQQGGAFNINLGDPNGLEIPSMLSPIKDSDPVPQRTSMLGRLFGK
ncbi:hypothetical protein FA15DRAFT_88244 [Coprinopsis marcescibilis]|uniref:Uncharacterized protein n=1 Tax=Coprinopsis marcescibilis TaxID=230819 RepID=A0A5C3L5U1_COPMA|nr:hypothetical protein FA15DRAFT_88244 [Coprinopsis marcescibilis]